VPIPGGAWARLAAGLLPGGLRPAFRAQGEPGCNAKAKADLDPARLTSSMNLLWYYPEQQAWTNGQHSVTCVVADSSQDLTSSLLK
jgi:hypothetical protein